MILQVGGSISFAPEGEGADAKWLSDDTRHMLAELKPKPDQVTIAINTTQMNIMDLITEEDMRRHLDGRARLPITPIAKCSFLPARDGSRSIFKRLVAPASSRTS